MGWETVLVALITAAATLGAVRVTLRHQDRTRWHDDQRAVVARLLTAFDEAVRTMMSSDDTEELQQRVEAFYAASHDAEILVPDKLLQRTQQLEATLTLMHARARLNRIQRLARGPGAEEVVEELDRFAEAYETARKDRAELVDAAREHFGLGGRV